MTLVYEDINSISMQLMIYLLGNSSQCGNTAGDQISQKCKLCHVVEELHEMLEVTPVNKLATGCWTIANGIGEVIVVIEMVVDG